MINRIIKKPVFDHPSNLGALIAHSIATELNINAYSYDPVTVDEMIDIARPSGLKGLDRLSFSHALNCRAMCMKYAKSIGKKYNELNLIVAHLGGGISLNAHQKGRMIDVISDQEGTFSGQRGGKLGTRQVIDWCFENQEKGSEAA